MITSRNLQSAVRRIEAATRRNWGRWNSPGVADKAARNIRRAATLRQAAACRSLALRAATLAEEGARHG